MITQIHLNYCVVTKNVCFFKTQQMVAIYSFKTQQGELR